MRGHTAGWWARFIAGALLVIATCAACMSAPATSGPKALTPAQITGQARQALSTATILSDSRDYLITLKMFKSLPFHPLKTSWNEDTAQAFVMPVGADTYASWTVGKQIAASGFGANLMFKGELSQYVVKVEDRRVAHSYAYSDGHTVHTVPQAVYIRMLTMLHGGPATLTTTTVNTSNATLTYVLHEPLSQLKFTSWTPLVHYWVTAQISNQSFTGSITKLIRNAMNKETITLEVSQQVYNQSDLWNPHLNPSALILRGHLSQLHGRIIKRWTRTDPNLVVATTSTGQTMVLPRSDMPAA